ncbi:MAG: VWA domain-containing protein, partial [Pyrinomonadaceae bacterium]
RLTDAEILEKNVGKDDILTVTSNLVVVPVSVTDSAGQIVQGLTNKDFKVLENDRTQTLAKIGDPEQVPIELAVLIDVSGSVNARFEFEKTAASSFIRSVLKSFDKAAIYSIASTPQLQTELTSANAAASAIASIAPQKDKTAFYDTVVEAAHHLKENTPPQHRRVIIVISDGEDTWSDLYRTVDEALNEVQRADAVLYTINPSGQSLQLNKISRRGQNQMEQLASATGGKAFVPESPDDLEPIFKQVAAELRSQYLLQYYSKSDAPAGTYLKIQIMVPARQDIRIRARQGYYSPGSRKGG